MNEELELLKLNAESSMEHAIKSLLVEFSHVRTGRANPAILERITISYYGVDTPINQVGSISVVEGTQLYIKPYDKSILKDIEVAIEKSDLGLPPANDGTGIRLTLPKLTEETRKKISKEVEKLSEQGKIAIRNVRRHANEELKKLELREDDEKKELENIQKLTDKFIEKVEQETKEKVKEVMTI